ncbi:hypothetical protein S40285_02341 [Stachybotrys chlorohalonatus IBT 40285]|uniref:Hpc2-related domain-containing protein n=1 Tax=Stachybotrys chlorohalonatus (strain IBT 40285) TaxID=1283841 RepID=A0A084QSE6_STAC4|nr:hypothetical protein S40285_02341 [Stachybotrys chlorohalonata IBT 40285]
MATTDTSMRYDSSPGELSSPPSGSLSEPGSPSRHGPGRPGAREEIVVGNEAHHQHVHGQPPQMQHFQSPSSTHGGSNGAGAPGSVSGSGSAQKRFGYYEGQWVQLTAAGLPRKKPGRKPGSAVKPKPGDAASVSDQQQQPKVRKPRKPRDPNAPPIQRKRKLAPASDLDHDVAAVAPATIAPSPTPRPLLAAGSTPSHQHASMSSTPASASSSSQQLHQQPLSEQRYSPSMLKREGYPSSMQGILNSDPPSSLSHVLSNPGATSNGISAPPRSSGQNYDPIRGNYDPVRETMISHKPFSSTTGSPRATTQMPHRSPSIASLIDPPQSIPAMASPGRSHHGLQSNSVPPKLHPRDSSSMPPSPSYSPKPRAPLTLEPTPKIVPSEIEKPEARKEIPPPPPPAQRIVIKDSNFTTISNGPVKKVSPKQKPLTGVSTPKTDNLDEAVHEGDERSILDFGKVRPGEETEAPTIVLSIPIQAGETNKYVNFMRMAEDRYGWDALHPRLAANRDRKARIAAAAASLEKAESGRESGDEMSVDLSDNEASNPENGGTSGPDANAKPKKKRNFKEDQYDVGDDFVDDSELLWEAQAAASRDGFFVYSGPLVPEVEKPAAGHDGPPKRGRGGRGSRGGRGASTRGGTGTGRGGGPGSRGGSITRKPRITKSEKAQREREKADRESLAQLAKTPTNGYTLQPTTPSFAVSELGA